MNATTRTSLLALLLALFCLCSCATGVEYPDYWNGSDHLMVNILTLPFELIFTPVIFILKIFPVL